MFERDFEIEGCGNGSNFLLDIFQEKFPDGKYTSGLLKDKMTNEIVYFHKKEEYNTKTTLDMFMATLENNVEVILYDREGIYYIYTDEKGWVKKTKCTFEIFQFFNKFVNIQSLTSSAGKMISMQTLFEYLNIDTTGFRKIKLSYHDEYVYLYNRYIRDEIVDIEMLNNIYIRYCEKPQTIKKNLEYELIP